MAASRRTSSGNVLRTITEDDVRPFSPVADAVGATLAVPAPARASQRVGPDYADRDVAIAEIKRALKERSGQTWSVTGGKGTSWGWITITAPPRRRNDYGSMTMTDEDTLRGLLGVDVHHQGVTVPASADYRREYVARAQGVTPEVYGTPYWD